MRKRLSTMAFILASFNAFRLPECVFEVCQQEGRCDCDCTTRLNQCVMSGPMEIKKFTVEKTTVCHPGKAQLVINGRGRGHCVVERTFGKLFSCSLSLFFRFCSSVIGRPGILQP